MTAILQRFTSIRREEVAPVLAATFYFFCILTALQVVRPARDALGMQRGIEEIAWLFQGTLIITLLVNPVFGLLVSRFRRMHFIAATYLFFAASLLVFYGLLVMMPQAISERVGQVLYVWFSVFNLFVTMVFWALMADRFELEQSKRFFAFIAVGGTFGALFGPWLASQLAEPLGTPSLLLVSVAFLTLGIVGAWAVTRLQPERAKAAGEDSNLPPPVDERSVIGGSAWEGFRAVFRSPYLLGISTFVLIMAVMATLIYFTRLQVVAARGLSLDEETALFGTIDFIAQSATLLTQLIIAGQLMKRFGVAVALSLLPITVALGFIGMTLVGFTLLALILVDASFRAVQRGLTRPARETLFTIVSREDKYKSKAFIDTFVYRGGDSLGAGTQALVTGLGFGLAALTAVAAPLAIVWGVLAAWLGRAQVREAARRAQAAPDDERAVALV